MPGSVANAVVPVVGGNPIVFPFGLSKAFTEILAFEVRGNEYKDGTSQRAELVSTSRRRWKLTRRLNDAQMSALRTFLTDYTVDAFYFYNPKDVSSGQLPGSNFDATGANTQGRYKVRSNWGELSEQMFMARTEAGVELVEAA